MSRKEQQTSDLFAIVLRRCLKQLGYACEALSDDLEFSCVQSAYLWYVN